MEEENLKQEVVNKVYTHISKKLDMIGSGNLSAEEEKEQLNAICKLTDQVTAIEANDFEYYDKAERREIERERNEATISLEKEKQKMDWKRFTLESLKVAIPLFTVIIAATSNKGMQLREHKFDGAGNIHTGSTWKKFNPFMRT